MNDPFIQFLWLIKNYISPIEGILPLVYKKRDYSLYEKIVNFYIDLNKAETSDKKIEILNSIASIYRKKILDSIANKLSEYLKIQIKNKILTDEKVGSKIYKTLSSNNNTDIDKINYLLSTIMEYETTDTIIDKDYNKAESIEDKNEDLTNKIAQQIQNFIKIFYKLQSKQNKNKNDKNTYIIASSEFFNALNHLATALLVGGVDDKCIRKNIHQAQGHLSRAIKDMKKLDMYLGEKITLEDFKTRIKEISPSNTQC